MKPELKCVLENVMAGAIGGVRAPLAPLAEADSPIVDACVTMIREAVAKY